MTKEKFKHLAHKGGFIDGFEFMYDFIYEVKGIKLTPSVFHKIEQVFPEWKKTAVNYYSNKFNIPIIERLGKEQLLFKKQKQ